ncbi:hypothetical protein [Pseudomonas veronii]|uniref:hypothetical protein n=1 Tax=Pseudomonas veronii TaxID=76761 RepID=UPI00143D1DEE|nr:hypothetical protein [Pseudomonas veronii]
MKTAPKILLVNKKGEPRTDVSLGEGLLHLCKGDELHVLGSISTVVKKKLVYKNSDSYELHIVYE